MGEISASNVANHAVGFSVPSDEAPQLQVTPRGQGEGGGGPFPIWGSIVVVVVLE